MTSPDYFALFQLPRRYRLSRDRLIAAYHTAQAQAHPDQMAQASKSVQQKALTQAALINDAYRTLKNPVSRARYLLSCFGQNPDNTVLSPAFLEEQLDAREAAEETLTSGNQTAITALLDTIHEQSQQRQQSLADLFDHDTLTPIALQKANRVALELQFLEKFANDIEERNEYNDE